MYKTLGVVWALIVGVALAVTQEELAQYVAQQQTASLGAGPALGPRRQAYFLQPQGKSVVGGQPREQIYQIQPKAAAAPSSYHQSYQGGESAQQYYQPQPQPQQAPQTQYYHQQPGPQPHRQLVGQSGQKLDEQQQLPEDYDPNPQYQFGFDVKDDEFTNYQNRKEQREGGKISGSYSVVDSDGYIRTVTYTADPVEGFKADVVREPTDIKIKFPQHPPQQLQYESQGLAARKQQTQQYLQASTQPKQQYSLGPEHTQVIPGGQPQQLRQYSPIQYQGQQYQQ